MISFDAETHKYYNEKGEEYISVTTLLSKYKKKFDTEAQSIKTANKRGMTKEEVIAEWDDIREKACEKGTTIHKIMETYVKTGIKDPLFSKEHYVSFLDSVTVNDYFDRKRCIQSEKLLWNDEYKIAGTCDIIVDYPNEFSIRDFKTNKQLRTGNNFNEYMLDPINYMPACEFSTYSLQLSLYAYLHEKQTNKRVRDLVILWDDKTRWKEYTANYLRPQIEAILMHHKFSLL